LLLSQLEEHTSSAADYADLLEFNPYAVQFRYEAFEELGASFDRSAVIRRVTGLIESTQHRVENSAPEEEQ
jgi:hypothetical protein